MHTYRHLRSVWYYVIQALSTTTVLYSIISQVDFEMVERFAFYERAKKAFAVVATG